ncbi:MAG: membrane protein insertase YidC [Firmicutes bacterium]|nr:membrane protein insertase YidC [Bacillota bacterium]
MKHLSFLTGIISSSLEFFHSFTGSWGLAIILLTVAIRLLLYPLTASQTKSMAAMRDLQPKMKELQAKYKDKPEEYQKRMLELYKEHKVNPLGGCLPVLLQMPILFALFYVLREFDFGSQSGFLWIQSLSQPDSTYLMPILTAVTTYMQMMLTPTDSSQKTMMYIMPAFIGIISMQFPAGLTLYWVVSNIIAYLQQMVINKRLLGSEEEGSVAN